MQAKTLLLITLLLTASRVQALATNECTLIAAIAGTAYQAHAKGTSIAIIKKATTMMIQKEHPNDGMLADFANFAIDHGFKADPKTESRDFVVAQMAISCALTVENLHNKK